MTDLNKINELADKWLKGTITKSEKEYFEKWYNKEFEQHPEWNRDSEEFDLKNRLYQNIVESINRKNQKVFSLRRKKQLYKWYSGVAAVLILAIAIYVVQVQNPFNRNELVESEVQIDVPPGKEAATLTLGNGSVIDLDLVQNGEITVQGKTTINKLAGQVSYIPQVKEEAKEENASVIYNTLNTARGNQYHLVLADSTQVWLNAASSLHFPNVFVGNERVVELTGEAYFEVAENKEKPFLVKVNNIEVEVLGTHFNINAYGDEPTVETTLLEGSVRVNSDDSSVLIKPGEKAVIGINDAGINVSEADIYKVMAWQKGFFEFDNMELPAIMRQISRWYDVDIRYEGEISNMKFGGRISKNLNLRDILTLLEANGVEFFLEDNTLTIKQLTNI